MKIAIVHDCLTVKGGAERVLAEMLRLFPEADLFALVDFLPEAIQGKRAQTSFIQKLPFAKKFYRFYFPLMPYAIENFDLSSYELILSSSYAVAKGVVTSPEQLHICYCHSPMRYAWDLQHTYLNQMGMKGFVAKRFLHKLRLWDVASSLRVDHFIANSQFIKNRIMKVYRRSSHVIYPPVDVERFSHNCLKEDFYLTCSRLTAYKRVDLIVETFAKMPHRKLIVIGDGPEYSKILKLAKSNVTLIRSLEDSAVTQYMERAKGFVFAAKEDFGIVCVEAQSAGTGVIAFGEGGALETVRGLDEREPTGCFFYQQSVPALSYAIEQFEKNGHRITQANCRQNAEMFSKEKFRMEFSAFVQQEIDRLNYESNSSSRGQWRETLAHLPKNIPETIFSH